MRLRNIPGAKEAVMESAFVVQSPQEKKGGWAQIYPQDLKKIIQIYINWI